MTDCQHPRIVCPKHHGSFDCNPFCDICEGEQDYCPFCDEWEANQAEIYRKMNKNDN